MLASIDYIFFRILLFYEDHYGHRIIYLSVLILAIILSLNILTLVSIPYWILGWTFVIDPLIAAGVLAFILSLTLWFRYKYKMTFDLLSKKWSKVPMKMIKRNNLLIVLWIFFSLVIAILVASQIYQVGDNHVGFIIL